VDVNGPNAARALVALLALLVLAGPAAAGVESTAGGGLEPSARYLESRRVDGGGFAEPGLRPTPGLTAWAVLGLRAAGRPARTLDGASAYLARAEDELASATDLQLVLLARAALGERPPALMARVKAFARPGGAIGPTVNSTIWGLLALRAVGERAPPETLRYLLRRQRPGGGWAWSIGSAPDSNDTAAAIQALRAAGVSGRPIARGIAFLRTFQTTGGGFELARGRGADVQSTAWAIQAFVAAGVRPPPTAFRYLERMRRPDGSLRYSARYVATPVWVTAQAVAALARKPLPIR